MVVYAYTCILSCFGLFIMPKRKGVSGVIDVHSEEYILGQNIKKYRAWIFGLGLCRMADGENDDEQQMKWLREQAEKKRRKEEQKEERARQKRR